MSRCGGVAPANVARIVLWCGVVPTRGVAWCSGHLCCLRCVMVQRATRPCCPCHVMVWRTARPCRPHRVIALCHACPVAGWRHRGVEGVVRACKQNLKHEKKKRKGDLPSWSMLAQCRCVTVPWRGWDWEVGPVDQIRS